MPGRLLLALPLSLGVLFASAASLAAKVIVKESTGTYTVGGVTGAEIYREMSRRGPVLKAKGRVIAATYLDFDIRNIKGGLSGRRCTVSSVDVVLRINYKLPRWKPPRSASAALRRQWTRYSAYVLAHEKKHAAIARDAAAEMHRALLAVSGDARKDCGDMADKVEAPFTRIAERHNARQERLDASPFGVGGNAVHFDRALVMAR